MLLARRRKARNLSPEGPSPGSSSGCCCSQWLSPRSGRSWRLVAVFVEEGEKETLLLLPIPRRPSGQQRAGFLLLAAHKAPLTAATLPPRRHRSPLPARPTSRSPLPRPPPWRPLPLPLPRPPRAAPRRRNWPATSWTSRPPPRPRSKKRGGASRGSLAAEARRRRRRAARERHPRRPSLLFLLPLLGRSPSPTTSPPSRGWAPSRSSPGRGGTWPPSPPLA